MLEDIIRAIADVLTPITIGAWLAIVPLVFYYAFVLGNQSQEERIKKRMYGWGIKVYILGVTLFSIGSLLFSRNRDELTHFCGTLLNYLPQILGVIFWVLTVVLFVYFFGLRRPLKRQQLSKEGFQ